ncbi:LysM peptidoglycan-binding domain-containing protein [Microbacterium sp. ZW T2_14]|uniref:LysM peptidoglycan-binding domain-containing protein n=1 Tax=Microbacterium sp. ZW T2_14 TaxID=3378079 RepID=UPI003854E0FE
MNGAVRNGSVEPRFVGGTARPTRLRLTVRGRRVLAALAALPAVIALSAAVIGGGAALATRDAGAPAGSFHTVTVAAGDSLWSIAEEIAPDRDPRDVVDELVRLNALDSVVVRAGQNLAIPTGADRGEAPDDGR